MTHKPERWLKKLTILSAMKSLAIFSVLMLVVNISQACTQGEQSADKAPR